MGGFIFYKGASQIDGSPVVGIATVDSDNRKTGSMIQTWIIRDDVHPVVASRAGADSAICGDCRHRGQHDTNGNRVAGTRTCYVMLTPVASVYRTLQAGRYDDLSDELGVAAMRVAGRMLASVRARQAMADAPTRPDRLEGHSHQRRLKADAE